LNSPPSVTAVSNCFGAALAGAAKKAAAQEFASASELRET
jgi:hypothetical protein